MDYVERMGEDYHRYFDRDPVLRYSDYAALRAIAGYPPVELKPGEYLIHCRAYLEKHLTGYTQPISLGGASLIPGGVHTEHLLQNYDTGNGASVCPSGAGRSGGGPSGVSPRLCGQDCPASDGGPI